MTSSGISSKTNCDPIKIAGDQTTTKACTATSAGGTRTVNAYIKIDVTPPVLTCPEAGPFLLNSGDHTIGPAGVDASISGLGASANNTLTRILTTESVGPKTLTFTAFDMAGNSASQECSGYDVYYNTSGLLSPVDASVINIGKAGRTYPIKWQLTDFDGISIGNLSAVTSITHEPSDVCGVSDTAATLVELSGYELTWRYDTSNNQYIYNWRTPGAPGCYKLLVTLDSGQTETAYFDLK